ncbi:MAG: ATP-binding cassette domain-containing protein [Nitrospirae bacterium]|nr:ATP-binding cassette domain-containing protein [Nitrospirota bacterium]
MIEFQDVHKSFNSKVVLAGVTLTVERGETMVVIGGSGTGKSVLLKHVIGLLRPDRGRIIVDGADVTTSNDTALTELRKKFGVLFQGAALFDSLTVWENVGFSLAQHTRLSAGEIRELAREKLALVGLKGVEDLMPAELSGGMKKRVGLARAIAHDPQVLLYDEPTTGLDPIMADVINHLIVRLKEQLKVTSIAITHDMTSAYKIADRIAMLYQGTIQEVGTPDEIRHSPNPIVHLVKMAGVPIGKVEEMGLQDSQAKVTFRIQPGAKIPQGSYASVKATGLLGDKYVEIVPGKGPGSFPNEARIPQQEGASDLDALINRFSAVADDVKAVTASLRGALGNAEGEQSLKDIVAHFRAMAANLDHIVAENREAIKGTLANAEALTKALKDEGPRLVATLNRLADRLERGDGTLGKLLTDNAVYDKFDSALANINTVTKNLEQGKGTLGKLINDDAAYEKLNTALSSLSGTLNKIDQIRLTLDARNEYQFSEGQNKGYFGLHITPRENKSYIVEVVDDPRGKVTKTTTDVSVNGGPPTSTEELKIQRKTKFSAEYFRRFGNVGLRGGLLENSFGVGADYFLNEPELQLSLDLWDFNSDDPLNKNVHAKATARYHFLKYLYVQAGYDNPFNRQLDTGFVGGGLTFDDEDLKYLIGSGLLRR